MKHFGKRRTGATFCVLRHPVCLRIPKMLYARGRTEVGSETQKQMMLRMVSFNLYSVFCGYLKKYPQLTLAKRRVVCFLNRRKTNTTFLDSSCRNYRPSCRDITFLDSSCRNYRPSCRDIIFLDSSVGRAHDC